MTFVHATCVALKHKRSWHGVLLRGASGAGKSDLALRLIEAGDRLVSDDQTRLVRRGRRLLASAPPSLAGLIEVRGVGIVRLTRSQLLAQVPVRLLVDLMASDRVERLPEPRSETILGQALPVLDLASFEASALAKLRLALRQIANA